MNTGTARKVLVLGTLTGMRSMSGLATLALAQRSVAAPAIALAAVGEMIADKTALVGDRIDPVPLAGRTIIGALVGAVVASRQDQNALVGGVLGAAAAFAATHLAYYARTRLPGNSLVGGLLEDSLVIAVASRYG